MTDTLDKRDEIHIDSSPVKGEETRGFAIQRTNDEEEPTLHLRTM